MIQDININYQADTKEKIEIIFLEQSSKEINAFNSNYNLEFENIFDENNFNQSFNPQDQLQLETFPDSDKHNTSIENQESIQSQKSKMGQNVTLNKNELEPEPEPLQQNCTHSSIQKSDIEDNFQIPDKSISESDYEDINVPTQKTEINKLWAQLRKKSLIIPIQKINKNQVLPSNNFDQENELMPNETEQEQEDFMIEEYSYVIMPDSKFKLMWNAVIIFFLIYTASVLPYMVCFVDDDATGYSTFDIVMNTVFGIDIVVTFFSAYRDEENELVTNNRYIAWQYFTGWFILDLLTLIPINNIIAGDQFDSNSVKNNNFSLLRLIRLPRMYRLVRLFKLSRITQYQNFADTGLLGNITSGFNRLNPSIKRLFFIMTLVILMVHLSACFYFLSAKIDNPPTWITYQRIEDDEPIDQYVVALLWAMETLTTVGFGESPALQIGEKIVQIIWMVIGGVFFAFMISNLEGLADDDYDKQKALINKLLLIQSQLKFPEKLVIQIKRQLNFSSKQLKHHHLAQNIDFIEKLPTSLRARVLLCVYRNILKKIPFFVGKDIDLIINYIPLLSAVYHSENEVIYQISDHPEELYFVFQGQVSLLNENGDEIMKFGEQDIFGELEIICNINRIGKAVATQKSIIFSMSQQDFINMILEFPEIKNDIQKIFNMKKELVQDYLTEEDRQITEIPLDNLLQQWREKMEIAGNLELSLKYYNVQVDQNLKLHGQNINKYDLLASIASTAKDFNDSKKLYFEEQQDLDQFISDLSDHYGQDLDKVIDELVDQTDKLKLNIKKKIDYYTKKKVKLDNVVKQMEKIIQKEQQLIK